MKESNFVENAEKIKNSADLLNYYRNLFHCESETTERGIVARAINDILPEYARQKAEMEKALATIDGFMNGQKALLKRIDEKDAWIESLQHYKSLYEELKSEHLETIKQIKNAESEAIKDFVDRAKKRIGDSHFQNYGLAIMEIMDVAKEMEGESNAT